MTRTNPIISRLLAGETIASHRESGNSMVPIIRHREAVTLAPVNPELLEKGDIVLAKVGGHPYTHKVSAVDRGHRRIQIANNSGHVNGWTSYDCVYGIVTHVSGVERPRAVKKVRAVATDGKSAWADGRDGAHDSTGSNKDRPRRD